MVVLESGMRLVKGQRSSFGSSTPAALSSVLEKWLVTSTQALLQPQWLIHSSQLTLKLHVRAGIEETRYLLAWAKETNVISDLQFHSGPRCPQ